jgi:hypothetical protein
MSICFVHALRAEAYEFIHHCIHGSQENTACSVLQGSCRRLRVADMLRRCSLLRGSPGLRLRGTIGKHELMAGAVGGGSDGDDCFERNGTLLRGTIGKLRSSWPAPWVSEASVMVAPDATECCSTPFELAMAATPSAPCCCSRRNVVGSACRRVISVLRHDRPNGAVRQTQWPSRNLSTRPSRHRARCIAAP